MVIGEIIINKKIRVYLSGAMSGHKDFNYPAFNEAAKLLREIGYEVFNPAESYAGDTSLPFETYMREDIKQLLKADEIIVLDGWASSVGATTEVLIGLSLGLPIKTIDMELVFTRSVKNRDHMKTLINLLQPISTETILQEAQRLVHGDRGEAYGHPLDDFGRTAKIWSAILGIDVQPEQVALCMVGVKISREVNKPKRDNRADGAGYFETLDMVVTEREKRNLRSK